MGISTKKYAKKPLYVDAIRITRKNFSDVVKWCSGRIRTERSDAPQNAGKKFIKIEAHNPINTRQTKAFVGDWVLKTDRGFKIYTHKTFLESFDEVVVVEPEGQTTYPHMDGGFVVIGPECFAKHDGSVLSWKGTNYVPQHEDRTVEAEARAFDEEDDDLDSCAVPKAQFDPAVPQ